MFSMRQLSCTVTLPSVAFRIPAGLMTSPGKLKSLSNEPKRTSPMKFTQLKRDVSRLFAEVSTRDQSLAVHP